MHEIKFDGYRLQAQVRSGKAKLLTRGGQDWTGRFGAALAEALVALPCMSAILDGELVVEGDGGASDFSALQADLSAKRTDRVRYYLFDLIYLDGEDLRATPLSARKDRLAALLEGASEPMRLSEHFDEDGEVMLQHACRLSLRCRRTSWARWCSATTRTANSSMPAGSASVSAGKWRPI